VRAHGKTPPCADALITAGIARVVGAIRRSGQSALTDKASAGLRRQAFPSRKVFANRKLVH
jgi:pyrimidine deaminase RibD-like protein